MKTHLSSSLKYYLLELEATEACRWLRATGFPQYAQMYEGKSVKFSPI